MNYSSLIPIMGTILNISRQDDCSTMVLLISSDEGGQVNFIVDNDTVVLGNTRLRVGMRVAAYYDGDLTVPLIYPPRYQAQLVAVLRPSEQGYLGYFDQSLVSQDQSLRLNLAPSTTIVTQNSQLFGCSLSEHFLFVYYSATTRSIPPQTTPRKIVVLN